jgi:hypothetical protein
MAGRELMKFGMDCKQIFNFPPSAIPARQMLEVAGWNGDDAIAYDPLRMRITDLTEPNPVLSQVISGCSYFVN